MKQLEAKTSEYRREIVRRSQIRRRDHFAKQGLCIQCGKCPPLEGRTLCQTCMDKQKAYTRKYNAKKKLAKLNQTMSNEGKS